MRLEFTKMHGLGNDFVVIDAINQAVALSPAQIRFLADRHFGIGCDQVLLVENPVSKTADFRYRIFNADGGEVAQCGNGARCFAKFVRDRNMTGNREITVETRNGQLRLVFENDDQIRVDMGVPEHEPEKIPLRVECYSRTYRVSLDERSYRFGAISLGNPHAVIQVEDVDRAPVRQIGPILETHQLFPQRVNVGFMQIINHQHIKLRVFERGSGETLACGSGACAAAVIGIDSQKLSSPVRVDLPGGTLSVSWEGRGFPVYLSGPAASVFEGSIQL